ncbi:MAG: hypothetical protein HRF50_10570 [Phycisphaerae bacterium]
MRDSLPRLIKFYDDNAALREKFELVAVHDRRAKTLDEVDEKTAKVREEKWGGKNIGFPSLLDGGDVSVPTWGISFFPTTVLIDPQGNVVDCGGREPIEVLAEKLGVKLEPEHQPG